MTTRQEQIDLMDELAAEPASMSGDQISVTNRSLKDVAEGYDLINRAESAKTRKSMRGVIRSMFACRLSPPGGRRDC